MIEKLHIKNYLIIKEIDINFVNGLNILSGETGAGKSIILDALSLILGGRADYSLIRKGNDKLIVEGHFKFSNNLKKVESFLKHLEIELENDFIIIRRELHLKGISRSFINDTPINNSDLKNFGDLIIDIHSQNEHQSLLNKKTHLDVIDNFLLDKKIYLEYKNQFNDLKSLINNYNDLASKKDLFIERKNYIEFQLRELNNLNLQKDEDIQIENELKVLENSEEISIALTNSVNALNENDNNVIGILSHIIKDLKRIIKYDSEIETIVNEFEVAYTSVKENSDILYKKLDNLKFDPLRIEQLRERLSDINNLKRKYKLSLDELIEKSDELEKEFNLAENFDFEIEELLNKINIQKEELFKKAFEISKLRKKFALNLQKDINQIFKDIGLESAEIQVEFKVDFRNQEIETDINNQFLYNDKKNNYLLTSQGIDNIEFLLRTNRGESFQPLKKIASGGEVSRIMLAIKAAFAEKDNVPILVFDEIDVGISGRIAQKVGKLLSALSKTHQLICITHLPQIAAVSDKHFLVKKTEKGNETIATIKELNEEEKLIEVAKLISGEKVTEASTLSAKELIMSYKN